uniref:SUI1 domain-containing protein n=1 Tax=Caenorhabditis tropicalis TaxID=1561998 RepID=A0A1I7TK64_9PELO
MEVHIASKKDLKGTEMYLRKDVEGTTHVVIAGKTGSPEEIIKYINDHGICIESGKLTPRIVHDEGRAREPERFVKVNNVGVGQSAMKCAKAPTKLEDSQFKDSYELKSTEENGVIKLSLVRKTTYQIMVSEVSLRKRIEDFKKRLKCSLDV